MNKDGVEQLQKIGKHREMLQYQVRTNTRQAYILLKNVLRQHHEEAGVYSRHNLENAIYYLQLAYQQTKELGG